MLLDIAEKFAQDKSPLEALREKIKKHQPFDEALWQEMVGLGWSALTIDEAAGGSGLGIGEAVAILEPMGRKLFATPLASSLISAEVVKRLKAKGLLDRLVKGEQCALAFSEPQGDWELSPLEAVAQKKGDTFALHGAKTLITHADSASFILLLAALDAKPSFFLLEREHFASLLERENVIDETQNSFRLALDGITLPKENLVGVMTPELKAEMERQLTLLLAAQMCGGIAGVLALLVEYLTTRKQFDKYIGSYQSLKHPTVDVLLGLEGARSHLYYAAGLTSGDDDAMLAAHMAKAQASDAFTFAADRAIQFHGAFGFTYDCDAQLYLRRALWCEYRMGDSAYHRQKIAEMTL